MTRTDTFVHVRSASVSKFAWNNCNNAVPMLQAELKRLEEQLPTASERGRFARQMARFSALYQRYVDQSQSGNGSIDWDVIEQPTATEVVSYANLPNASMSSVGQESLSKLAVLKLNGGLGTSMGCVGPKSAVEVRGGMNFMDMTVRQLIRLNEAHDCHIPLVLMNSFNTEAETSRMIQKYGESLEILTFEQSKFPRIQKDSLLPVAKALDEPEAWYPPGHGDMYESLVSSGLLEYLLNQGKEYLFVSNIDNLGAVVDCVLLGYMVQHGVEFLMEVTDRTRADVKGGTLVSNQGRLQLLELAQVPKEHRSEFASTFIVFNTNNVWLDLRAIKRVMDGRSLDLDIICNVKEMKTTGEEVIQLETALGAAVRHFDGAHGVNVPRSRFLPVKTCSDLFLLRSDMYIYQNGCLTLKPQRTLPLPIVKLGDYFRSVSDFMNRIDGPINVSALEHLTVSGDVSFGRNVTLKGTVVIVANHGCRIEIPDGSILQDKVVTGNIRLLDH